MNQSNHQPVSESSFTTTHTPPMAAPPTNAGEQALDYSELEPNENQIAILKWCLQNDRPEFYQIATEALRSCLVVVHILRTAPGGELSVEEIHSLPASVRSILVWVAVLREVVLEDDERYSPSNHLEFDALGQAVGFDRQDMSRLLFVIELNSEGATQAHLTEAMSASFAQSTQPYPPMATEAGRTIQTERNAATSAASSSSQTPPVSTGRAGASERVAAKANEKEGARIIAVSPDPSGHRSSELDVNLKLVQPLVDRLRTEPGGVIADLESLTPIEQTQIRYLCKVFEQVEAADFWHLCLAAGFTLPDYIRVLTLVEQLFLGRYNRKTAQQRPRKMPNVKPRRK